MANKAKQRNKTMQSAQQSSKSSAKWQIKQSRELKQCELHSRAASQVPSGK
jgi:hypothetical protein